MARFNLSAAPSLVVGVEYNASNGRVTDVMVTNTSGATKTIRVRLTDGRAFSQAFGQGTDMPVPNFPTNIVSVSFDADGEPTWTGLAQIAVL
jgi:hypothetical protein